MTNEFSLNLSIKTDSKSGKTFLLIQKKITDETEIKIFCNLLLENKKLLLPLVIEDSLQFYSKLKQKKVI